MISLLISLLIGPPLPVDGQDGVIILEEPQTYQLEKGADPGSFHFARKNVRVAFSMEPDFPVRLVAEDYAGKEVTGVTINSTKPFDFNIDLPPGSYTIRTKATAKSKHLYWDSDGFQIHINKHGVVHYSEPPEFSRVFHHARKIEIISPKNLATLTGKTVYVGWHPPEVFDPEWKRLIPDTVVRWKPLPGIKHYVVVLSAMENPFHRNSVDGEARQYEAAGSEFRFSDNSDFRFEDSEHLAILDGDLNGNYGDVGNGGVVVMTSGAEENARAHPSTCIGGDEWIDTRTAVKYAQARAVADYDGLNVIAEAIGDGPANNGGLLPDETIYSVNGAKIQTLDDLRATLSRAPVGKPILIEAGDDKSRATLTVQ